MNDVLTSVKPPKNPAERRAWIGYRLKITGKSLAGIADALGISRQSVYTALSMPSERVEQAIADALKIKVTDLFPERFDQNGMRIHRRRPDAVKTNSSAADSQKSSHAQTGKAA